MFRLIGLIYELLQSIAEVNRSLFVEKGAYVNFRASHVVEMGYFPIGVRAIARGRGTQGASTGRGWAPREEGRQSLWTSSMSYVVDYIWRHHSRDRAELCGVTHKLYLKEVRNDHTSEEMQARTSSGKAFDATMVQRYLPCGSSDGKSEIWCRWRTNAPESHRQREICPCPCNYKRR
jgi:hypothetical protein